MFEPIFKNACRRLAPSLEDFTSFKPDDQTNSLGGESGMSSRLAISGISGAETHTHDILEPDTELEAPCCEPTTSSHCLSNPSEHQRCQKHAPGPGPCSPLDPLSDGYYSYYRNNVQHFNDTALDSSQTGKDCLCCQEDVLDQDQIPVGTDNGLYTERGPKRKQAYIWQCVSHPRRCQVSFPNVDDSV